jgi:hypothetical protein
MTDFVSNLRVATIQDGMINLPDGVGLWGDASMFGRKLLVRDCYEHYFRRHFATLDKKICVYTGSPGIGKSMFSLYVLWRLLATDDAIAASSLGSDSNAVSDDRSGATSATADNVMSSDVGRAIDAKIQEWRQTQIFVCFLGLPTNPWYIRRDGAVWQGTSAIISSANIVFWDVQEIIPIPTYMVRGFSFASPAKRRLLEPNKKANTHVLIMPPWNLDELQRLRTACFPQTTVDEVQERFQMIGGKPRNVFEKITTQEDIIAAVSSVQDYQKALQIISCGLYADDELISLLTVVLPRDDPRDCTLSWASKRIADSIYHRFADSVRRDLQNFVLLGGGIAPIAVARGWTFERLVHDCLPLGDSSELEALPVDPHAPPTVLPALPQVENKTFKSLRDFADVPPGSGIFYHPEFSNLCAVDSFIMHGDVLYAYQVTVSEKHKIKVHGLKTIWDIFQNGNGKKPSRMLLVFVLPNSEDTRARFTKVQDYTTVAGGPLMRQPAFLQHVTQWRCFVPRVPRNI